MKSSAVRHTSKQPCIVPLGIVIDFLGCGQYIGTRAQEMPMNFKESGRFVQIIRSTGDRGTKKGKNEIVGRLIRANPQVSKELNAALSADERKEVASWIARHASVERLKRQLAVHTLPEQLSLAEEWFSQETGETARFLAASLIPAWGRLRAVLRKNGYLD